MKSSPRQNVSCYLAPLQQTIGRCQRPLLDNFPEEGGFESSPLQSRTEARIRCSLACTAFARSSLLSALTVDCQSLERCMNLQTLLLMFWTRRVYGQPGRWFQMQVICWTSQPENQPLPFNFTMLLAVLLSGAAVVPWSTCLSP